MYHYFIGYDVFEMRKFIFEHQWIKYFLIMYY